MWHQIAIMNYGCYELIAAFDTIGTSDVFDMKADCFE